jgi:hypothetical protein
MAAQHSTFAALSCVPLDTMADSFLHGAHSPQTSHSDDQSTPRTWSRAVSSTELEQPDVIDVR